MIFFRITIVAGLLLGSLISCHSTASEPVSPATPTTQNFIKVTFNGQTKTYTDVALGSESQLGNIRAWEMTAGASAADYLTISVYGTAAGTFPYRQAVGLYNGGSQVEYKTGGKVFNNYKALLCPTSSGYYSTTGQVVVAEYVAGKLARGTFTGALLDPNDPDECSKQGQPFSGEFYLTKK